MYQKLTRAEKERMYQAYISLRNKLESNPMIIAWKTWSKKPKEDQLYEIDEWNKYYAEVKKSVAYEMFMEQRDALRKNNHRKAKDIASDAKGLREAGAHLTTDEPDFVDPWEFRHNPDIKAYIESIRKIKELTDYQTTDEIFN